MDVPTRRKYGSYRIFIGGWVAPSTKAKLVRLAQERGQSANAVLRQLIDQAPLGGPDAAARADKEKQYA
jgi:hypothetical protein